MAYETGLADGHDDLFHKILMFLTTNTDLVTAGQEYEITDGRASDQVANYIDSTGYSESGLVKFGKSVALGSDDQFSMPNGGMGWNCFINDAPNSYIGVEFATATAPTSYRIRGLGWTTTDVSDRCPLSWILEYSDDGSAWSTQETITGQNSWSNYEEKTFTISGSPTAHLYWRVRFTDNNGHATLLSIATLRFYNASVEWISYRHSPEVQLKSTGLSGTTDSFFGMRLYDDSVNDTYNIAINGFTGRNVEVDFDNQPQKITDDVGFLLSNTQIRYWIVGNGERFQIVVNVSTIYSHMYIGRTKAYAFPNQYPYPMLISGSSNDITRRWSDATPNHTCLPTPTRRSCYLYTPFNTWQQVSNKYGETSEGWESNNSSYYYVSITSPIGLTYYLSKFTNIQKNPDDSYTIVPLDIEGLDGVYSHIDGLFWVTGDSNSSENIITINSVDYLVFQRINRTTFMDYAAMRLS
jgi:hypothetical protein